MSLTLRPHHRAAWLNLLLPYCPESFEMLVSTCPECGPLGWDVTRGIANCERCGEPVPRVDEARLPNAQRTNYRHFADLVSGNQVLGATATDGLPREVRVFPRTELANFAVRTGMVINSFRGKDRLSTMLQAPAPIVAEAVISGMEMLRSGPTSISNYAREREAQVGHDLDGLKALSADLRWIAEVAPNIMSLAFPTLNERAVCRFAKVDRYYAASEVSAILSAPSKKLTKLREIGAIRFEQIPSKAKVLARYNADDVEALRDMLSASIAPGNAAAMLDLPVYAMSHLVQMRRLELQLGTGIVVLKGPLVTRASVQAVMDALQAVARPGPPPRHYVPLRTILASYPGEKPWAGALEHMIRGSIAFHLTSDRLSVREALIEPKPLQIKPQQHAPDPLKIELIAIRDAQEILGMQFYSTVAVVEAAGIDIVDHGQGKGIDRKALRALSAQIASTGEVAAKTGIKHRAVKQLLQERKMPTLFGAWLRTPLVDDGMVMPNSV